MVTMWALMLARARARAGVLLAVGATIAVLVLGLSAVIGAIGSAVRAAVVAAVDASPEEARSVVVAIPSSSDPDAQRAGAADLFARLFGDSLDAAVLASTEGGSLRWELTVSPDGLDPWGVPALADALGRVDLEARAVEGLAPQGASTTGGLAATLATAAEGVRAVQAVIPVPLALIAIGGLVAALQLARLLGDSRAGEASLLRARGLPDHSARRGAILESIGIVAAGALVGWMLSALLVTALGSGFVPALRATWAVPLVSLVVLGPAVGLSAHRAAETPAGARARRAHPAVAGLSAALIAAAAAVFVWQLRGLAERGAAEDLWTFVVIAVAPALALAAASVIVLTLFAPVARLTARLAARRPGIAPVLPARTVARQVGAFGVVVALVALASGGAVMAGASITTWAVVAQESAQLRAGGDARATVGSEQVTAADVDAVAQRADAAPVLTHSATVSDIAVAMVALPDEAVDTVVVPVGAAAVDPTAIARELAHDPAGVDLPMGADRLTATFDVRGSPVTDIVETEDGGVPVAPDGTPVTQEVLALPDPALLEAEVWLLDAQGTPERVPLALSVAAVAVGEGVLTADAPLPQGAEPWTLVGLRVGFKNAAGSLSPTLTPTSLTIGAAGDVAWPTSAPFILDRTSAVQIIPFAPVPDAVPAVVSSNLAAVFDVSVGDEYDLKLARSSRVIRMTVTGVVDAVPGAGGDAAVMLPLGAVTQSLFATSGSALRVDQVWASGADAGAALASVFGEDAVDDGAPNTALTGSLAAAWWVATMVGGLLAAVAVIAAATALARRRASEVFVLRALGVTPTQQARSRSGELAVVAAVAAIAGVVLGAAVAALTLPALTLAAVPGAPAILTETVVWGWAPPATLIVLVGAAVVAAGVIVARIVSAQSRAGRVREAS